MMLISSLTEMVDVSKFGSRIAVVNGNSGKYMVNPTHSVMQVFQDLKSSYGNFPTFLSLEQSLLSISSHMDAENSNKTNDWSGLSQVILVVSQNQQISTDAFDRAKTILQGEYTKYHDLYFIFLTDIPDTYKELVSTLSSYPEAFRKSHFLYVESSRKEPSEFNIPLMRTFRNIKKYLHIPPCIKGRGPDSYPDTTLDSYEDYVSRQQDNYYQINSQQLSLNKHFFVKFQGVSYGSITVCMERTHDNLECLSTLYNEFESVRLI
uniref:Uncharacterized protein n=1 Tax=Megaselia scalaris TaxID=36166 RepID=T1H1Y1_MEGSC